MRWLHCQKHGASPQGIVKRSPLQWTMTHLESLCAQQLARPPRLSPPCV